MEMRDIFLDGLKILDLLELTGSTAVTAAWVNCDQSSVSRTYRRVSQELNLAFCKHGGRYTARSNLALLTCLRQAAQMHRLSQGLQRLQWISHTEPEHLAPWQPPCPPLPRSWDDADHSLELLRRRVIDLAVMPANLAEALRTEASRPGQSLEPISLLPLHSGNGLTALVLAELDHHNGLHAWLTAGNDRRAALPRILATATA